MPTYAIFIIVKSTMGINGTHIYIKRVSAYWNSKKKSHLYKVKGFAAYEYNQFILEREYVHIYGSSFKNFAGYKPII